MVTCPKKKLHYQNENIYKETKKYTKQTNKQINE